MFKPKKSLGQNFLTDSSVVGKIIQASELKSSDVVLEIGPGTGILTDELIKNAGQVLAVEKDFELTAKLQKRYKNTKNLKIIHQDALFFDPFTLGKYKVIANIPYNISSPLVRKFLENEPKPELMVLMLQKEVAERITAKPGSSERGFLTLICEFFADAEIVTEVSRKSFYPVPKVDSAVVKIRIKNQESRIKVEQKTFFNLIKAGFSSKRRQIHNSLSGGLRLSKDQTLNLLNKAKIDPQARAEDLSLAEWLELYCQYGLLFEAKPRTNKN